ncbi:hypothetical protein [Actinoplanes sp. NPDC026670]|uniref:hypothetical protein n=1 Tax=Actinoplanes sp. NPDC026670 TaxID=3154700 RepID=UPI0033EC8F89
MRSITRGVVLLAAAATVLTPAAAQASPAVDATGLMGTFGFGRAAVIGAAGLASGAWSAYAVRSGYAGDDLIVSHPARTTPLASETVVYTAAFNEVADPRGECQKVGAAGVAQRAWVSFRCRTGFVPSYTLLVR